jgi:hypothetical protein
MEGLAVRVELVVQETEKWLDPILQQLNAQRWWLS